MTPSNLGTMLYFYLVLCAVAKTAAENSDGSLRGMGRDPIDRKLWGRGQDNPWAFANKRKPSDEDPEINGGTEATLGEFPFMVSLQFTFAQLQDDDNFIGDDAVFDDDYYNQIRFSCGGSLISANRVLTAAHCFFGARNRFVGTNFYRTVRVNHNNNTNGEEAVVECVKIHPDYYDGLSDRPQTGLFNDLAIIKLKTPVTSTTAYLSINSDTAYPPAGTDLTVIGFGQTNRGYDGVQSDTLQKITTAAVSESTCAETYGSCLQYKWNFCAQVDPGGTCAGDSGSPLFDNNLLQVGIVSYGVSLCGNKLPDAYTNVAQYKDWITEQFTDDKCTRDFNPKAVDPCSTDNCG